MIALTIIMTNNQQYNKAELQAEVNEKARASVADDAGLDELMRFTLDNFAYRYLETKNTQGLKSQAISRATWRVEGQESELIEALKAQNEKTKQALIAKAKAHAKKDGATVYPWIEIEVKDSLALCRAGVDWESDGARETIAKSETRLEFEDGLHLRNKIAKSLEEACGVF